MNKEKRTWIVLFITLALIVILAGCSGLPKIAEISIIADPNPVSYSSEDENWHYTMNISENNGVGVTVSNLIFNSYSQEDELEGTTFVDAEEFFEWFGTDYIPAFSTIYDGIRHTNNTPVSHYSIVSVAGIDDNGNPVEATVRIDYLPE